MHNLWFDLLKDAKKLNKETKKMQKLRKKMREENLKLEEILQDVRKMRLTFKKHKQLMTL